MPLDDTDLLNDDPLPDDDGVESKTNFKMPFIIFLIISPIIIFGTVYLSTKMMMEKSAMMTPADSLALAEAMQADSAIMNPDSSEAVGDTAAVVPEDPYRLKSEDMLTDLLADSQQVELANQEAQKIILERFGRTRQVIQQQQRELNELRTLRMERDEFQQQMTDLEQKTIEQENNIKLLQNEMPDRIVGMMKEYQTEREKQITKEAEEAVINDAEEEAQRARQVKKMADIYAAMKSNKAAIILSKLKDSEIKEILLKMRERNAAKILAEFDPQLSARISRLIGGGK